MTCRYEEAYKKREIVRNLYNCGVRTHKEMRSITGFGATVVCKAVNSLGLDMVTDISTANKIADMVEALFNGGFVKYPDLLEKSGLSPSVLNRAIKKKKLPVDTLRTIAEARRNTVKIAYDSGLKTYSELIKHTGLTKAIVTKACKDLRLDISLRRDAEIELESSMIEYAKSKIGCTSADIQREFGTSQSYVSKLNIKHGLSLRVDPQGSIPETELREFIAGLRPDLKIVESDRAVLRPKHLDIYLPEINLAFEFNGMYTHSSKFKVKKYHQDKTKQCAEKGIRLIHVFGDQWEHKRPIVESIIRYALGVPLHKKYARKLEIREVPPSVSMKFQNDNHMLGSRGARMHIGLYDNEELVSLMTFGISRSDNEHDYELLRFCNKLNTAVVGGAERLWAYFKKANPTSSVICYADASLFTPNLYGRLGLTFEELTPPCAWYYNKGSITKGILPRRYHRSGFTRQGIRDKGLMVDERLTVAENMKLTNKYLCIHDCGSYRLSYKPEVKNANDTI